MSLLSTITNAHIRKLDHTIEEIRVRALNNVISKLDLGFECDSNAVKKELLVKLFNWFSIEPYNNEEKVLDLIIKIIKSDNGSFFNSFGKVRFQNELRNLRAKLNSKWHDKLNTMEEIVCNPNKFIQNYGEIPAVDHDTTENNYQYQNVHDISETSSFSGVSPLDGSVPFDLSINHGDATNNAVLPRKSESSIKWLVMPWQILAQSDKGILARIENSLSNSVDVAVKIQNCHFITNIMLQDFPAEIFLQRPTTVNILLALLETYRNEHNSESYNLIIAILKTLYKLSRALRFRIFYYCDPSIAHKPEKILLSNMEHEDDEADEITNESKEYSDENYNPHQIPERQNTKSPSLIVDPEEESLLQLHQMLIPNYCTETMINVLKLMSIPSEPSQPLKIIRYIADLLYELVQLIITSIMPTIWFCNDNIALKIHDSIKTVLEMFSEILDYFCQYSSVDYYRITYLYFLWLSVKLMSNTVPLEVADQVIPKKMKLSICSALMDAPVYLMYKSLHFTLQQYARKFRGPKECDSVKLLDETRLIAKSMKAAISLMKTFKEQTYSEELKAVYASKLSLLYHKNFKLIRKFINLAQNKIGYKLNTEDKEITNKMLLALLAHSDSDVQDAIYSECHSLVSAVLGNQNNTRYSWKNIMFLFESTILTEIVCYGTIHENKKIQSMAEDILLFLLKGKVELTEPGWLKFLEALLPVLPLLQCLAHPTTQLGKSITQMLNPDISSAINLPFIEVLKGNIRLLFSPASDVKTESLCRILWLLEREKDSDLKYPRLSSLHEHSLSSLFVFDRQICTKRPEGHYQKSALTSTLELLQTPNVEPKLRKSALVQISVMMTDLSLHKLFISENGLKIVLDIFSKALIERDFHNFSDSVIPIVTILKNLVSCECSVRIELSNQIDVYYNTLRSLFLFPHNEGLRNDGTQLLALLLYSGYIMRLSERTLNNPYNISLPYLITINMRLPFTCKAHWKTSIHRKSDISILHRNNATALTFIRQYWAWHWNGGEKLLWMEWENINDPMITSNLMLRVTELTCLSFTSLHFYMQRQLFNIQNSVTHKTVSCAIDYLTMYLKLSSYLLDYENFKNLVNLQWAKTFGRFIYAHPNNEEDYDLFNNVLNFLHLYIKIVNNEESTSWVCKAVKSMMKSFEAWLQGSEVGSENVHQSVFKLTRACSMIDTEENEESQKAWIGFVKFTVSHLFHGEFYNLAFLDWVLSTLSHVIGKCKWKNNEELLMSVGSALVELILSFHRDGSISFMGLTNIRDCMICLNHVLYQMQHNLSKNHWIRFWYAQDSQEMASLNWLPLLWRSRDPLVRASTLQLLANLINGPHTALQLLNAIDLTPDALCHSLLYFITNRDEACIVKELACLAMSNLIKNSSTAAFQYLDGLNATAMMNYVKENNAYHEIALMCSKCYMLATLDTGVSKISENDNTYTQSLASSRTTTSDAAAPKTIYYYYDCAENIQGYSDENTAITNEDQIEFITTPSLITSLSMMINNLIAIGGNEVIRQILEHSIHKHMIGCIEELPKDINGDRNLEHYHNVLEMYTSLCTVLTNCIIHSPEFASLVTFSPEFIRHLFNMLDDNLYFTDNPTLVYLQNRLGAEILKFLVSLSLTENQHADAIQVALETCNIKVLMYMLCNIIKNSKSDLGISAIGVLAFLLSLEMQNECEENKATLLKDILDNEFPNKSAGCWGDELQSAQSVDNVSKILPKKVSSRKNLSGSKKLYIGGEICKELMVLYIAINHTKPIKKTNLLKDREVVTVALSNLLSVSIDAKKIAIEEKFPTTCLTILKETYIKLNSIPVYTYKTQIQQKKVIDPLIMEVDSMYMMLMNYMYDSKETKQTFAKAGLADIVHKLWAYVSINKKALDTSLKLLSTFTTDCSEASQSLPLTTTTPGVGLRKTPNSLSLVHVIVQLVVKEIDSIGRNCDCNKLNLAFHILRNAIHNHDCRVVISKSNLLQFFTKIHPSTTKRTKLWQVVELNCLEFLIDFTFYEEGQLHVSKATDSLEVLINLARISSGSIKLLAISILRNLAFHPTNRPRLLGSTEFLDLLLISLKEGSSLEIELAGSTLWSLISNNQKGKLIARSAGFEKCIKAAISRLTLPISAENSTAGEHEQEVIPILEYVLNIMSPK